MRQATVSFRELKFASSDTRMAFSGYASVFGIEDSYGDVIARGAFARSLSEASATGIWPAMLLQHGGLGLTPDDMTPIGVWTAMAEDDVGLYVEGVLADTTRGRDAYALMKMAPRPAIDGLSIGYIPEKVSAPPGKGRGRILEDVSLVEVSLVTFPANPAARVTDVKSNPGIRDAERALREAGFSRTEAKAILAAGFRALRQRDAVDDLDEIADLLRRNIGILRGDV